MKKVLVVVDMQNDFCSSDGVLTTPEAQAIVPKVAQYIRDHADKDTILFFTKDTHDADYLNTQEGKKLPIPHCLRDTYGWELAPEMEEAIYDTRGKYFDFDTYFPYVNDHIINKPTFGSVDFQNLLYILDEEDDIKEITFLGIDTSICVISNAMLAKATLPEATIRVVADCCSSITPEIHNRALETMRVCQIEIV